MATNTPNPFEQTHQVALYRSLKYGGTYVSPYYGERDEAIHGTEVRISEPTAIQFVALSNEDAIRNAIKALDAEEMAAREELGKRLSEIKQQRASLLALTHQPEVPA